jgi:heat-inducible transcriptional repressor
VAEVLDTPVPGADELDDRKRRVLHAIVAEYVATGQPVGSQRVVQAARLDVSSATVRNEMAALEELGLIHQPHTSAGRVPTDRGYRVFVEDLRDLPPTGRVSGKQEELIAGLLTEAHDVDDLLTRTTAVLSQLTRLVSLVIAPAIDASRLKLIELVSLSPQSALLLLVADTGRVTKRVLELPDPVAEPDLDRVRTVLSEHVRGRRMGEVHEAVTGLRDQAPPELRGILAAVADVTATAITDETLHRIFVSGRAALADEGSFERDDLSRVLSLLEEQTTLARVLDASAVDDGPTVRIGRENEVEDLHSASLVAQRYQLITAGSLGVLGPTRMDYASVLAAVRAVAQHLEATLTDLSE